MHCECQSRQALAIPPHMCRATDCAAGTYMHLRGSGSGAWRQLFRQTAGNYRSAEDWLSYNAGDHSGDCSELDQLEAAARPTASCT